MNNEIKEILDIEKYKNKDGYVENINLLPSEIHKLLDYITNLQQENEKIKNYYNDNVNKYEDLLIKYNDLQRRKYKAIDLIKKEYDELTDYTGDEYKKHIIDKALNILQGSDKDA